MSIANFLRIRFFCRTPLVAASIFRTAIFAAASVGSQLPQATYISMDNLHLLSVELLSLEALRTL